MAMKDKQTVFSYGFLIGVLLTVLCWRTFESIYIREILMVPDSSSISPRTVVANGSESAPSSQTQPSVSSCTQGPANAPVTLLEFSDFYCPYCARVGPTIEQLMQAYPGKIKRVWKHFPLPMHTGSDRMHEASECAGEQGQFWPFHREVFAHQSELSGGFKPEIIAAKLGLNAAQFSSCVESRKYQSKVRQDIEEGNRGGIHGTPSFMINGQMFSGAYPLEHFKAFVENALDPAHHPLPSTPKPPAPKPRGPVAFDDLKGRPSEGPENAPVTLVEFSDFYCPFCARISPTIEKIMKDYSGKVRRVWRHYPLPMHQGAHEAHEASECASEQGKFWAFHDQVFTHQPELREKGKLETLAKNAGLNVKKWNKCMESKRTQTIVDADIKKGNEAGVSGTPAAFINGYFISGAQPYENFKPWIEHFLNPNTVPLPKADQPEEQAPDVPLKPVVFDDLEGKPSQGPANAKVTLVEFSDFHCPFCKRVAPTIQKIVQRFDGKIRHVWRHYPLPMHQGSERTHQASECAREQGKFWEFHGKAFENQEKLADIKEPGEIAKSLSLNIPQFENCLESGKYKELVKKEFAKGNDSGVHGTPAFFINGKPFMGARPYEQFEEAISEELKKS
ncbi:MAG: hypothetical protein EXS63_03925 [Candidatus Omnitrophica bacterium]|nr:hypothetical protein [Candidatus Omnitrophota bacterium]